VIAAHCIHRNGQHVISQLFLYDFDHFAALVLSAMRAHTVRQLGLMAVGTLGEARGFQGVVGAAGAGALLGVSTFRIRHISILYYNFVLQFPSRARAAGWFRKLSDL